MSAKRVLALIEAGSEMQRLVMQGVATWLQRSRAPWQVSLRRVTRAEMAPLLRRWRGDGALCNELVEWRGAWLERLPFPCVNSLGWVEEPRLPSVLGDDRAIGAACAEHLLSRGFRRIRFVGEGRAGFARRRADGVRSAALAAGAQHEECIWRSGEAFSDSPEPCGYVCGNDQMAAACLAQLQRQGIRVPEEAAVVGINNDPLICGLHHPGISSCDIDFSERGRTAAALLQRLMDGEPPSRRPIRIPPRGVVQRASSEALASGDAALTRAWHFLSQACDRPLCVDDVVAASGVSRRCLEQRVKLRFNFGLQEAIWRAHVERAKVLLQESEQDLLGVALDSGFQSASSFSTIFKRYSGQSPREWRKRWR